MRRLTFLATLCLLTLTTSGLILAGKGGGKGGGGTRTAARYIIPMALTQPVYPGQDKNARNGGIRIMPYAAGLGFYVNPTVNVLQGNTLTVQ